MPPKVEPLFVPDASDGVAVDEPTQIVPAGQPQTAIATTNPTNDPLVMIQTAIERGYSPEALNSLVDLKHKMDDRAARQAFNRSLVEFKRDAPVVRKTRAPTSGPAYKYCAIEDTIAASLNKHGFAYTFPDGTSPSAGMMRVSCKLTHIDGHSESTSIDLPIPAEMRVNATQKAGAALSYAKRYSLCMVLGLRIVGEDNDGHGLTPTPDVIDRTVTPINHEQSAQLFDLIEASGADRVKFFQWASQQAGRPITKCDDLPASCFSQAVSMLQARQKGGKR